MELTDYDVLMHLLQINQLKSFKQWIVGMFAVNEKYEKQILNEKAQLEYY